ncbi:hypothetical protein KVV02_001421 [Mortierella alpina]|uniref:Response regulatory domain-containing protein n=1 Tax=Mortierella alpina TaxID=64518 RepID=A0A9P8A9K0_MORAP|nr:hypothetical protein KVV02_001421 [Mortierella alpina]
MIPSSTHNHSDSDWPTPALDSWIYSLLTSTVDPIIACDLQGNICAWNHGAQQTFGIPAKQSLGKNLNRLFASFASFTSAATATATAAVAGSIAEIEAQAETEAEENTLYPSTPEEILALKAAPSKRVVSRTVKDRTQRLFLESLSAIFEKPATPLATSTPAATVLSTPMVERTAPALPTASTRGFFANGTSSHGTRNGRHSYAGSKPAGKDKKEKKEKKENNAKETKVTKETKESKEAKAQEGSSAAPTPVVVGYSVILTDLSSLSTTLPLLPLHPAQPAALPSTTAPLKPPAPSPSPSPSPPQPSSSLASSLTSSFSHSAPSPPPPAAAQQPTGSSHLDSPVPRPLSQASSSADRETSKTALVSRPVTSREHSTDSGFDERSSSSALKASVPEAAAEPYSTAPSLVDLIPSIAAPRSTSSMPTSPLPPSRSNSISLPIPVDEPLACVRTSARSTSLGQLLALPLLNSSLDYRPRALSIAATAVSSTSTGTQLSVSMSSSPDKSRLDIHHNSLTLSNDSHPSSLLSGELRLDREWDDPYFTYLAPIAASLLTCHGDHFFDLVCEELAINLGVKYAFISQLVSLDELKELDPTEYMNLIEQFGGLVPPIDGVMHNISSWPGESHINPHAFQGYLADCTIQDKVTLLKSSLADQYQDVAECLMDHTIESYVGMRLETAQGEIVGVIGIIHDRPLTDEDGAIVKVVLDQVGIRVANELDRLRVEANLIYARDVAESTAKNKTKFLADMSHEIRNPMNAVVGVTDILLDTAGLSTEQASYVEVIRTSGQHLLTVINDILDISRIDQDVKFLLERRPLSLRKCLKDAVSLAGLTPLHDVSRSISVIEWPPEMDDLGPFSELEETNILPLLWSIDHNVPEHLLGDITRLRQVLINLCTNSLKFTQRGRVSVHVSVHQPTAQYPTIRPNSSPTVTRNAPHGGQIYYPGEASSSSPSSPMLTGTDQRTPMVFQQRYDVKADSGHSAKPSPASSRRRPADKRHLAPAVIVNHDHTGTSRFTFTIPFTVCQSPETDSHPSVTAPSSPVSSPLRHELASDHHTLESFALPASSSSSSSPQPGQHTQDATVRTEKLVERFENISTGALTATTPSASAAADPSKPSSPTYAKVVESSLKPLAINGVPLRILLAEDNAVNQKIAVGVLKKLGYENVDVAENGLEVIDKLDQGSVYDVILMDVSMPVMDGLDATKAIVDRRTRGLLYASATGQQQRCSEKSGDEEDVDDVASSDAVAETQKFKDYLNIYVIALTASAMGSDKERCMEAGMDDFMTKPFALLEMKRVLNDFIIKWNDGALQARNDVCLAAALAAKSRCNSPYCQGGLSAAQKDGSRSLTPTSSLSKSPSASSSSMNLAELGATTDCLGCCGTSAETGAMEGPASGSSSPPSSSGRGCRMETPRPLRRNLDAIGCSLFSSGRRSNSEVAMSAIPGSANNTLPGPLGPSGLEGALLSRRASDAFAFTKREWRSGLGQGGESGVNGAHDIHPLDTTDAASVAEHENSGSSSGFAPHHLRVKRVMSPSSLSKEHDLTLFKPMASPLSPLSLLTTDTEGSSSVSPPLSSSSSSSPTEEVARSNGPPSSPPLPAAQLSSGPSSDSSSQSSVEGSPTKDARSVVARTETGPQGPAVV